MKTKFNLKKLDELTPKRMITIAIIVVVIVVVVWILWDKIGDAIQSARNKAKSEKKKNELINKYGEGTVENYTSLCQSIYNATAGNAWGADADAVIQALNNLGNQADYYLLCESWTAFWNEQNWWERNWDIHLIGDFSTLAGLLTGEFNKKKLERIRKALTDKGITPDF